MIRDATNLQKLKLNVFLKDGSSYLGRDTTPKPLGENERIIAFWVGDIITIIPMDLVKRIEMYFED